MRNFYSIVIIVVSFFLTAFTVHRIYFPAEEALVVDTRPAIKVMMPRIEAPKIEIDLKNHSSFLEKIGHYESGNRYEKVNRWGYMGRYQFGQETLHALDIKVTKKKFLTSPMLQEQAMSKLLEANRRTLRRYIKKYDSKIVNGIYVTESGILAAAHLGGAGSVIDWFKNGVDFKDANGTPITRYMKLFSGYQLDLE
jgi:hypothetical protein